MNSMLRHALQLSALCVGLAAVATPAYAQGRSRGVPPGIAKNGKCPPGLEKQGRCGYDRYDNRGRYDDRYDYGRDGRGDPIRTPRTDDQCWDRNRDGRCDNTTSRQADWCWDRNHDGRCDSGTAGRVYDRADPRYDPNTRTSDRERGGYVDRTIGDLIDRARQTRRSP